MASDDDEEAMLTLAEPVEDPVSGELATRVPVRHASVASAMASSHPPTNPNVLIASLDYWNGVVGYNDPIVRSLASWLCYQLSPTTTQADAGLSMDQHAMLEDRLDDLGIGEVDDD